MSGVLSVSAQDGPADSPVEAPDNANGVLWEAVRDPDKKRPEDQFRTQLLGRPLTLGGEFNLTPRYRRNFDLDPDDKDGRLDLEAELELELLYEWSNDLAFFFQAKARHENYLHREQGDHSSNSALEREETWVLLDHLGGGPWSLQIGRQNFSETREWWWDEDLDALRLRYRTPSWSLEMGLAEELARVSTDEPLDPEEKDVLRWLGRGTWRWAERQRLELFFLHQSDHSGTPRPGDTLSSDREDGSDADLTWVGVRALGRWKAGSIGRFK